MYEVGVNNLSNTCVLSVTERYMVQRYCVCGKRIAGKRHLCDECVAIYGARNNWPEWLRFWVNDTECEARQETRINEHEVSFTDLGVY